MKFEDLIKLVSDLKILFLRIKDVDGNLLYSIDAKNIDESIQKLSFSVAILCQYEKIFVTAATESIKKQHWRDAYLWRINLDPTQKIAESKPIYLKDLNVSTRLMNNFAARDIYVRLNATLQDVCKLSKRDWMRTRHFGKTSLKELTDLLDKYNLKLSLLDAKK